jgi:type II secretory pathway component PulJ
MTLSASVLIAKFRVLRSLQRLRQVMAFALSCEQGEPAID